MVRCAASSIGGLIRMRRAALRAASYSATARPVLPSKERLPVSFQRSIEAHCPTSLARSPRGSSAIRTLPALLHYAAHVEFRIFTRDAAGRNASTLRA